MSSSPHSQTEAVGAMYDTWAEVYAEFQATSFPWLYIEQPAFDRYLTSDYLPELTDLYHPETRVLDIGCGGGLFLLHLNRAFPHMPMIGMDISMTAIKEAQSKLKQWKKKFPRIKVNFQLQKNVTLDIPPKSVDIIISTLVCHHLEDDSLSSFLQRLHSCARNR